MFSHMMVGSNDIARSKRPTPCSARWAAARHRRRQGAADLLHNGGIFMVSPPIDGEAATHANGATIGFTMADPARPTPGTRPAWTMAAPRSRTAGPAPGQLRRPPRLICAIPTATSSDALQIRGSEASPNLFARSSARLRRRHPIPAWRLEERFALGTRSRHRPCLLGRSNLGRHSSSMRRNVARAYRRTCQAR